MNNIQPQNQTAPIPQQVQQPTGYIPQQQVQQPTGYAPQPANYASQLQSNINFYGVEISQQESQLINQFYINTNNNLGIQLNDNHTVFKSLYFGCRDMFKTLYVNQISSERGSKPTTPDYEKAQQVFEQVFGTVAQPKVNERILCLTMKAFAPNMLPDPVSGERPHIEIMNYILDLNWHSQNVRQNSNGISRSNGNNTNTNTNVNPYGYNTQNTYAGNNQSKAGMAAGLTPMSQQVQQPTGYVPQQQVQQPTGYAPQQTANNIMAAMPTYG